MIGIVERGGLEMSVSHAAGFAAVLPGCLRMPFGIKSERAMAVFVKTVDGGHHPWFQTEYIAINLELQAGSRLASRFRSSNDNSLVAWKLEVDAFATRAYVCCSAV